MDGKLISLKEKTGKALLALIQIIVCIVWETFSLPYGASLVGFAVGFALSELLAAAAWHWNVEVLKNGFLKLRSDDAKYLVVVVSIAAFSILITPYSSSTAFASASFVGFWAGGGYGYFEQRKTFRALQTQV